MRSIEGQPILTAAEMRAAEDAVISAGTPVTTLMRRVGEAVAEQVRRLAVGAEVLVLCGPGNNGGDGYVAAIALAAAGLPVRVAATGAPKSDAATAARKAWSGDVATLADAAAAPILLDAVFGTGLSRPLAEDIAAPLARLRDAARLTIAVDLPSGVGTDDGADLGATGADLTLALGALKPAHLLQPAAAKCGDVRLLDIGIAAESDAHVLAQPSLAAPPSDAHKYSRGMVAIVAGAMPGAAALAATAAGRAGAGYVLLLGSATDRLPHAIVRRRYTADALADDRIGALLIGPGFGRDDAARERLAAALATRDSLVVDGDALRVLDLAQLAKHDAPAILTPHAGEFGALFGSGEGSKLDRTRAAAARANAIVVFKGADTVIAAPDGRAILAPAASSWLSTAGTGDVLAGAIAAQLSAGHDPLDAAAAGVWLHTEAARRVGASFLADDLAAALTPARAAA